MRFASFLIGQVGQVASQADPMHPDVMQLIFGDWGSLNWLRPIVLFFLLCGCVVPVYRGMNIIAILNVLCFPFWLNDFLKKHSRND